jgi:N-succinyldiaminopimelate aminotransferase
MRHWGEVNGDRFVRLVFSNEPLARLAGIGARARAALGD